MPLAAFALRPDALEMASTPDLGISAHADYVGRCIGVGASVVGAWVAAGSVLGVVDKLELSAADLTEWCRALKHALGCGGSVEHGAIMLQGDLRARLPAVLAARGVRRVTLAPVSDGDPHASPSISVVIPARNERGNVQTALDELRVVRHELPGLEVIFVEEPDESINPLGIKGVGEIGIVGVAAAIANAIYHATGKRVRELPITLDKLQ